ncbi:urokinase plasminogen activator surface receptor-like [Alosa sapidissima]|uniref:urokinase plasminogen activator surface receptor-like n=1 Tax=Alosa sapidissima TaxID=34773 RepID=UPI001C08DC6B|nr:urokinase plasminogen activator surface receptor-like [Alosa sapidissima]
MKPSIILGLLCTLFCEVAALSCYSCTQYKSQKCNNNCTCNPGLCASVTQAFYEGGTEMVMDTKCCLQSDHCIAGSIDLGVSRRTINTECCEKNMCNTQNTPEMNRDNTPNGKKCFTCVDNDCTKIMDCVGNEDCCIKTMTESNGQKTIMKGCASSSICKADVSGLMGFPLECCEGSLCNRPKTGGAQSALILLGSLLSVVIIILIGVLLGLFIRSRNKCNYCSTNSMDMYPIDT